MQAGRSKIPINTAPIVGQITPPLIVYPSYFIELIASPQGLNIFPYAIFCTGLCYPANAVWLGFVWLYSISPGGHRWVRLVI